MIHFWNKLKLLKRRENCCGVKCCYFVDTLFGYPTFECYETPTKNRGVRTLSAYIKGDLIIEFFGTVEPEREREIITLLGGRRYDKLGNFVFRITVDGVTITPVLGSVSYILNHSCNPNSEVIKIMIEGLPRFVLRALMPIECRDELTIDYCRARCDGEAFGKCLCLSPNCRKFIHMSYMCNDYRLRLD